APGERQRRSPESAAERRTAAMHNGKIGRRSCRVSTGRCPRTMNYRDILSGDDELKPCVGSFSEQVQKILESAFARVHTRFRSMAHAALRCMLCLLGRFLPKLGPRPRTRPLLF